MTPHLAPRMTPHFKTLALVGRFDDPRVTDAMVAIAAHAIGRGATVLVDRAGDVAYDSPVERVPETEFAERADLLVAIGGDGTMLHAARLAVGHGVPLLGINRGRLGFLADISSEQTLDGLEDVLAGRYARDERRLLAAQLHSPSGDVRRATALNDVVMQKWDTGRMLDFETWIDGRYVNTHGADGLVAATSTGSTAYALSCGGPIIHPTLDALVLAPISPHTLSDRPIVVSRESSVEVRLVSRSVIKAQVMCDAVLLGDLEPDGRLTVGPAAERVTLLHPPGYDYYRILRSKLHWGRGARHALPEN
jgi:NAD+ kinase